ncbi:PRC-barrel domain-containing protein [Gloeocapsa sp. PCC 73106]|uniref:PRC-barrel domain-containing protein n=1 Tax=Gloeocapsa sp. PCC 73106 TaxID=102232 RepID=UPI0002ACCD76|nr:PRC-barrel domain-containing protein [Gloeocapsa sp. PCC 73106]ELR98225.1 hypothetical protein GLO73106DRAFT_00020520 [Gloeocapsa sp. PCC 73106]
MTTDNTRLRTEILNAQVITRNTGKRLGVIKELLVDVDRREVVALGLRDNRFSVSGLPKHMYLGNISQTGDVILVEDEDVIEDVDVEAYSQLINSEVITEAGEPLGRVRDFQFNPVDGKVSSIIIASLGYHQIPEQLISTYELSMDEVISSGPNRLIVFESAEDRLIQISVGVLERIGIGKPPWEKEQDESYYPPVTPAENQLPSRIPIRTPIPERVEEKVPIAQENWSDDDWEDSYVAPTPKKQAESLRYPEYQEDFGEDNWSENDNSRPARPEPATNHSSYQKDYDYDETENDLWDDDVEPEPLQAPRLNLTERQRAPEYEEEK